MLGIKSTVWLLLQPETVKISEHKKRDRFLSTGDSALTKAQTVIFLNGKYLINQIELNCQHMVILYVLEM